MTGPYIETYVATVRRLFGPQAELEGCLGTPRQPGTLTIRVGAIEVTAPTFSEVLTMAQQRAAQIGRKV